MARKPVEGMLSSSDGDEREDDHDQSDVESSEDEHANATQRLQAKQAKLKAKAKAKRRIKKRRTNDDMDQDDDDSDADSAEDDNEDNEDNDDDEDDDDEEDEAELRQPQTLEEMRKLRRDYRELQQEMEDNKAEWVKQNSDGLIIALTKANSLFDRVTTTQEAYLDSRILTAAANLSVVKVNNMKLSGRSLDVSDFLRRVKRKLTPNSGRQNADDDDAVLDWTAMKSQVSNCGFAAPALEFLYGPLAVEPKAKREIKRNTTRLTKDPALLKKPQQLKEEDIQKAENETSKVVAAIMKVLQKKGNINFFEFVINPTSFSQSVENIFYVSFLIRDGHVAIDIDIEDGQPILCVVPPGERDDDGADGGGKKPQKQHVIELTYETWRDIIKTYHIKETVIPTRPKEGRPAGAKNDGKWYG